MAPPNQSGGLRPSLFGRKYALVGEDLDLAAADVHLDVHPAAAARQSPARNAVVRDGPAEAAGDGVERGVGMWFYEIRGTGNRLVKRDGRFTTEQEAIDAGNLYLKNNRAAVQRREDPNEVFSIMAGRHVDFIRPDPASQS